MRWSRAVLVVGALLAAGLSFFVALLAPVKPREPYTVPFLVRPGSSLRVISGDLEEQGLIRERRAFQVLARLRGEQSRLQAGTYRMESNEWAWTVLDRLVRGDVEDTTVTIPEGLWLTEIATRIGPHVTGGSDGFLAAARDSAFVAGLGVPAPTAEGFLFPETYRFTPGAAARDLVAIMVATFFETWKAETNGETADLLETVTLASIVEAEAQVAGERPRIAAVYLNRLRRDLPLQADPTVVYALGERRSRVLYADLEIGSPYNTYRHPGLPPGPIGNPGRGALGAVLRPEPGCRDLYFVATGDGSHLFAPDFRGHRRNRQTVERMRRQRRP